MARLAGKVALITGGARGQGAAEARLFSSEGAKVVITDVLDAEGEVTAQACGALYLHHDVRSEADWQRVVERTLAEHGRIDVLINNAGIFRTGSIVSTTLEQYREMIDVNQVGVFLGMKAVAETMIDQQSGSIVNISSVAGLQGTPNAVAYGASKWAVRGMTKTAAKEFGRFGIRVNSIHPGLIDTPMIHDFAGIDIDGGARVLRSAAIRRPADPGEVAALALFLASDESSYSTGSEFVVDGGWMA
ncbi:MAG: glucose 1-dehydrogenase [Dehalococcoidia bacterium]|nr:glucose 1-dehydrogenase [Dehalococcoidia bacterium]